MGRQWLGLPFTWSQKHGTSSWQLPLIQSQQVFYFVSVLNKTEEILKAFFEKQRILR